jgi:hypothetical protein
MPSIGLVANVYNEINALPGWLETHLPFFDDVRVLHAGPGGAYSDDGTLELLDKWRVPVGFTAIDEGFGHVRTLALRMCPCDWVMLLDADERFYPLHRTMGCTGQATPQQEVDWILQSYDFSGVRHPNWENVAKLGANLRVDIWHPYDQGARLRELIGLCDLDDVDAIATVRRHWHDLTFRRPTQNWHTDPDWQMRLVRNVERVRFDPSTRMHERLVGVRNVHQADMERGPFFDHFHFTMKKMEERQRGHDVAIYNAIHEGRRPPTWEEHKGKEGF